MMYTSVVNGDVYTSVVLLTNNSYYVNQPTQLKQNTYINHQMIIHTIMKDNLAFKMPAHSYQL